MILTNTNLDLNKNCTICIDWFEVFCKSKTITKDGNSFYSKIAFPTESESFQEIHTIILQYEGKRTPQYNCLFKIIIDGEQVGVLQAFPHNPQIKTDAVSFKLENNILYTDYWLDVVTEILSQLELEVNNVTRLDIAIDGLNYLLEFLNQYAKQKPNEKNIHMKGRAKFDCKNQNHKTLLFESFTLGTMKSDKQVVLYLKSKELENSNKKYIERFWQLNQLIEPITYRLELRLFSKAIANTGDFDLHKLTDTNYLASLFKTHTNNYFAFCKFTGQKNKTREIDIDVINFSKMGGSLLPKNKRGKTDDRYKAKLTIHLLQKQLLTKETNPLNEDDSKSIILENLKRYDLEDWYHAKMEAWREKYFPPIIIN